MATSSIRHQVAVSSVPVTEDVPTRINIKKRRERVVYRTLSSRDNINIAYLLGQETTPGNNTVISDRSTSLTQNRIPSTQDVTTETVSTFTLNVDRFLVTDQFTEETPTLPATPVFFVHRLKSYNDELGDFSDRTLLSIEFADNNLRPIEYSEYVLDSTTGELFNNVENSYDDTDGSFDVAFVKYTVRIISGGTQTVEIYHELVNNLPIYTQADFDDVDAFGNIIAGRKKYLVEEQVGGQQFLITMPTSALYAYKETPESRIRVLAPTAIDNSAPWNVRVSNGQFITSLQTSATAFVNHKYYIAEFNAQTFSPFPPYKLQAEQKAVWLQENLVRVPKNIVDDVNLSLTIEVVVRDSSDALKYIYSTDDTRIGTLFQDGIRYTEGILSIDGRNGFLELEDTILDSDEVTVTYYTEEDEYEFTPIDFNPVNNLDILNQRVVLYVNPETFTTGNLDRTLYYLIVNTLGEITYCSQVAENSGALDPATQKMVNEDFDTDGTPSHQFYYDQESTVSGLSSRVSGVHLDAIDEFSFIDKYTVESVLLTTTVEPSGTALENFEDNPRLLVLGDIFVGENLNPDSLSEFDVREQGGGIKEEYLTTALGQQPEAAWYWDLNANRPYPSVGAFMAEVPQTLLEDHGGDWTRDQVNSVIERHMDAAGYAVLKTYGVDPAITDYTTSSGYVQVCWPDYGQDVAYNVYYSTALDAAFVRANVDELENVSSGNCFTVSGLNASTKYYVKVSAVDENDDESFSQVIAATTTAIFA